MHCRFLYLVDQLGPGGSERQLCYLLQIMDRGRYRPAGGRMELCRAGRLCTEDSSPQRPYVCFSQHALGGRKAQCVSPFGEAT